jgi:hypothetical protein
LSHILLQAPGNFKTELKKPDCCIVLNVLGRFSSIAVCPKYSQLKRYNLDSINQLALLADGSKIDDIKDSVGEIIRAAPVAEAPSAAKTDGSKTVDVEESVSENRERELAAAAETPSAAMVETEGEAAVEAPSASKVQTEDDQS